MMGSAQASTPARDFGARRSPGGHAARLTTPVAVFFLIIVALLCGPRAADAQPVITLPTNVTFSGRQRGYFIVHTNQTTPGSPLGVVTHLTSVPAEWPAPSQLSSSQLATAAWTISLSTASTITSFNATFTFQGNAVSDFSFDGTASSLSRSLTTSRVLWTTYGTRRPVWVSSGAVRPGCVRCVFVARK